MNNLTVECPLNSVSFGAVSINILQELHKLNIPTLISPIGQPDISAYEGVLEQSFLEFLQKGINNFPTKHKRSNKNLKIWHLSGSLSSLNTESNLFSFHELDQLSPQEINVIQNQKNLFVSSDFTRKLCDLYGLSNVTYIPLGFDSNSYKRIEKRAYEDESIIVFGIYGKFEKRKHTEQTLRILSRLYGNNPKYRIHVSCHNVFYGQNPEQNEQLNKQVFENALEGKKYFNIVRYPYVKTTKELSQLYNSCDIVCSMSGGEAWDFGLFNCLCLGKHAVCLDCTANQGYTTNENAVLVKPSGKENSADGVFFHPNQPFNQGNIFSFESSDLEKALKIAEDRVRVNRLNTEGLKLQEKFKWSNTVEQILKKISQQHLP